MFGHRPEGRRVRDVDPIVQITPYLMPMRCDAQVFLDYDVEYEPLMRYIAKKSREGVKITFMEILIASFVRGVSQVPEVNRFIMNKQFYNRRELTASFTLLMDTDDGSIEENTVKIFFDPTDTIYDVSARVKELVAKNRKAETSGFAVKLASAVLKIPLLPSLAAGLVKLLDRYGLLPNSDVSEIAIAVSYLFYVRLYWQIYRMHRKGQIPGRWKGVWVPLLATCGAAIILSGGLQNRLFFLYAALCLAVVLAALAYHRAKER